MKRKTIIVLSLLSALFSLIYILSSYYGWSRYLKLHLFSMESYIPPFSKLDKADEKRVVVSFTTTPERLKKLKPMLNSLLDQTVKVDEITLSLPYGSKVPYDIKDIVRVCRYSSKYGDTGKLIPCLLREGEEDTKIIVVDDNMVYGKDFIETLVSSSNKYPDHAIAVNQLSSRNGVLIKPKFFNEEVSDYDKKTPHDSWLKEKMRCKHKIITYKETYPSMF